MPARSALSVGSRALDNEAAELHTLLGDLVITTAPQLLDINGVGVDTAAILLTGFGDNLYRPIVELRGVVDGRPTSVALRRKGGSMAGVVKKSFGSADEVRTPDKTRMEVVDLGGVKAARMTAQPGWRWSECIKPVVGGDSCQARHVGTVVGGSMHVVHDDGTEQDIVEGDAYLIEPGHDAWVSSDQPMVAFEFDSTSAASYAKPTS